MYLAKTTVNNIFALHSSHNSAFCKAALSFKSSIYVEKDNKRADGKNLLYLLSLDIHFGDTITIITEGSDEYKAALTLSELLEAKKISCTL